MNLTTSEELAALPEPIQEQLLRIARLATGMSTDEKAMTRLIIGTAALQLAVDSDDDEDDSLATAELLAAAGRVVQFADENAGALASWLVV